MKKLLNWKISWGNIPRKTQVYLQNKQKYAKSGVMKAN